MLRPRTTKGLAKRIELTYYQRPHPFRRWWRILGLVVPSLGALWLLAMAALGDQRLYTSGPVVTAHAMFDAACDRCHAQVPRLPPPAPGSPAAGALPPAGAVRLATHSGGWFFRWVSDGACLGCHDGAVHHETQKTEPACVACHVEHKGRTTLVRLTDRHCTLCHADLPANTKGGPPKFEPRVVSLPQHPEFALFRKGLTDQAAIKLSHATHLKEGLPAGGGKRVTLGCVACHKEDGAGRYMLPVVYATHCAECHRDELTVTAGDLLVPHESPELVRGFLLAKLGTRGAGAPAGQPGAAPAPGGQPPPGTPPAQEQPTGRRRSPGAWLRDTLVELAGWPAGASGAGPGVLLAQRQRAGGAAPSTETQEESAAAQPSGRRRGPAEPSDAPAAKAPATPASGGPAVVAQAEAELFGRKGKGCQYCHVLEPGEGLPKLLPTKIPDRWLPHSVFHHRVHRPLACEGCHEMARKSTETTDVLMAKIEVCRACHQPRGGARSGCVECHIYHDRGRERPPDGPLSVPEFVTGRPRAAAPPAK
jgi:hypothetical protein